MDYANKQKFQTINRIKFSIKKETDFSSVSDIKLSFVKRNIFSRGSDFLIRGTHDLI